MPYDRAMISIEHKSNWEERNWSSSWMRFSKYTSKLGINEIVELIEQLLVRASLCAWYMDFLHTQNEEQIFFSLRKYLMWFIKRVTAGSILNFYTLFLQNLFSFSFKNVIAFIRLHSHSISMQILHTNACVSRSECVRVILSFRIVFNSHIVIWMEWSE